MKKSCLISLSSSVYHLLLYLFPASFRQEFGREMYLAYRDYSHLAVNRDGLPSLFQIWLTTIIDLLATAFVERLKKITHMSADKIIRFCGSGRYGDGAYPDALV
jgi:hypothetical protein